MSIVFSVISNIKDSKLEKYSSEIQGYTETLDKYAFGDYKKEYSSLLKESKKMIKAQDVDKIVDMKSKYKALIQKIESSAEAELGNYLTEANNMDISRLDDDTKNNIAKDLNYVTILIQKKYYKVAYNEIERIKENINKSNEEIDKKKEEEAKKQKEQEQKDKENNDNSQENTTVDTTQNNNDQNSNEGNQTQQNNDSLTEDGVQTQTQQSTENNQDNNTDVSKEDNSGSSQESNNTNN